MNIEGFDDLDAAATMRFLIRMKHSYYTEDGHDAVERNRIDELLAKLRPYAHPGILVLLEGEG